MTTLLVLGTTLVVSIALQLWLEQADDLELRPRYRLVAPALVAVTCALLTVRMTATQDSLTYCALLTLTLLSAACNAQTGLFPDRLTLPGIVLGCTLCPWLSGQHAYDGVVGAVVGGGAAYLVHASTGGVGLGDVKVLAMIGAFVGPGIKSILLLSLLFILSGAPLWLWAASRRGARQTAAPDSESSEDVVVPNMPSGPFYAAAVLVHVFFLAQRSDLAYWPHAAAWW